MELTVKRSSDFELSGDGNSPAWDAATWQNMTRVGKGTTAYGTRCKVLYSDTGIYFLFDCEDRVLSCTMTRDHDNIFQEDVVEIFLDPAHEQCGDQRVYFEHELSPLDVELTIMVPNDGMRFHGWLPWNYSGARRILHATSVIGGNRESMATCKGWRAECFVPFALLSGLSQVPPTGGTRWRGNMFRIDYDDGQPTHWAWDPATGTEFHDYRNFGTLVFE